jgi:hypothetical protein
MLYFYLPKLINNFFYTSNFVDDLKSARIFKHGGGGELLKPNEAALHTDVEEN